jgi:hypothetical protein
MQLRQSLLSELDDAIALLQQRPDSLEPFTAWLGAAAAHFLPGVAAAVASSKPQEQLQGEHRACGQQLAVNASRCCMVCALQSSGMHVDGTLTILGRLPAHVPHCGAITSSAAWLCNLHCLQVQQLPLVSTRLTALSSWGSLRH